MLERFLDQIGEVLRLCEDTDGILVVNREGIIEYHRIPLNSYWCSQDTVGRHILELYPELDGESSTILTALRTGRASYNVLQDINNHRGERVLLESTTIPIVVDGRVECVVDSSKYHTIDQRVIRGGEGGGLSTLDRMLTEDPAMLALKSRIRDVAGLDSSVLIYGETGTGKELVAESLHSEGGRAGPFVSQNCAAIPATLLESLFFGTEKGSYTGALTRKGLLEEADGGTLFLDEINSMDPALQAKLLKVLEEKKVRRLGGSRDIPFDVRIVAAVNEKPQKLIREGRLREDLYYRLGVIRLTLPPLRERLFFHLRFLSQASFHVPGPGREALAALPALLFRFIGGKGPDQVLFALAPPVVISRQDPVDCVQVIRQAQLRVLCLHQPFFTSSMVVRR